MGKGDGKGKTSGCYLGGGNHYAKGCPSKADGKSGKTDNKGKGNIKREIKHNRTTLFLKAGWLLMNLSIQRVLRRLVGAMADG